jgi:hypothetical protein
MNHIKIKLSQDDRSLPIRKSDQSPLSLGAINDSFVSNETGHTATQHFLFERRIFDANISSIPEFPE